MQRALLAASSAVLAVLLAQPGLAQERAGIGGADLRPSISLGGLGGGHFFAEGTNLGVASAPDASAGARSNAMLGLRATLGLGGWAAVEAEAFGMITPDRTYDLRATILGYRLNTLAFLTAGNLRPFFLLGAGVVEVVATHADGKAGLVRDRDGELHVGAGLDYRIVEHLSARVDARVVEMPGKRNWSLAPDIEATLALALTFGAGPRAAAPSEQAPAVAVTQSSTAAPAEEPTAGVLPPVPAPMTAVPMPAPGAAAPVAVVPAPPVLAPRSAAPPSAAEVTTAEKAAPAAAAPVPQGPSVKELLGRGREIRFQGATSKLSLVAMPLLGQLAEALVREPGIEIEIVSHTAASGNAKKDLALSRRRAEAVKRALVQREVDSRRLTATGRGSEAPLAPNVTRSGRRLNERIELRVLVP